MKVQVETPEPPVREPARTPEIAPVSRNGDLVGKERYTEKFNIFGVRPIPSGLQGLCWQTCDKDESGFCFFCGLRK